MVKPVPRLRVVMLILTHSCNLNCIYCYEKNKTNNKVMTIDVAKRIIDCEIKNAKDVYDRLIIHFMGGEPLLCFDLIREVCEWIWSRDISISVDFAATTNGTLMSVHKKWLWDNRERFNLVLSADGNNIMQDINRSSSSQRIDYDFFKSAWPHGKVKMTISPLTISNVADGVMYLHDKGIERIEANLALGLSLNWKKEHIMIYRQELRKLIGFYLSNPILIPVSMLNVDICRILSSYDWRKRCHCGENLVCYETDGSLYPCHLFAPITLDISQQVQFKNANFNFSERQTFVDERCSRCVIRRCCPRCPSMNYQYTKTLSSPPSIFCYTSKIEFLATCTLLNNRLKLNQNVDNVGLVVKSLHKIKQIITKK